MSSRPAEAEGRVVARPEERLLVLQGDVDMAAVEAFDGGRGDDLAWVRTIDVSAVGFVDTQGLGLMLRVAAPRGRAAPSPRPVVLGASPQVRQLLEMLGVESLFDLRPSTGGAPTAGPSTDGPSTEGPSTAGPSTDGPSTDGPSTDGPSTDGPSTDGPSDRGLDGEVDRGAAAPGPVLGPTA